MESLLKLETGRDIGMICDLIYCDPHRGTYAIYILEGQDVPAFWL
jgi:hypothetical protein